MYKVIVLAHALKGNKVAKFGDKVSEEQLNGNAKDLVKAGYIEKLSKKELDKIKAAEKAKADAVEKAQKDAEEKAKADAAKKK